MDPALTQALCLLRRFDKTAIKNLLDEQLKNYDAKKGLKTKNPDHKKRDLETHQNGPESNSINLSKINKNNIPDRTIQQDRTERTSRSNLIYKRLQSQREAEEREPSPVGKVGRSASKEVAPAPSTSLDKKTKITKIQLPNPSKNLPINLSKNSGNTTPTIGTAFTNAFRQKRPSESDPHELGVTKSPKLARQSSSVESSSKLANAWATSFKTDVGDEDSKGSGDVVVEEGSSRKERLSKEPSREKKSKKKKKKSTV